MNIPNYMNNQIDTPTTLPLNPDEGSSSDMAGSIPAIPLPNPGEGGSIDPGFMIPNPDGGQIDPDFSVPSPDMGPIDPDFSVPSPGVGPIDPDFTVDYPVIRPNGTIITVYPRPIVPCFFCGSGNNQNLFQYGNVRFLNTAVGYNPFVISVNGRMIVRTLEYAQVSQYGRILSGYQTITVSGANGYVFIQKQVRIVPRSTMTIAIVNTASGLDLVEINDVPCGAPRNLACFRVCNLSYNGGPMNVVMNNGYITFSNVRFGEVTAFNRIPSGYYDFYVEKAGLRPQPRLGSSQILLSSSIYAQPNTLYTLYIFNWDTSPEAIRTMVVEDRQ